MADRRTAPAGGGQRSILSLDIRTFLWYRFDHQIIFAAFPAASLLLAENMASHDIEIIKEIKGIFGGGLSRVTEADFTFMPCYVADKKQQIISLSLSLSSFGLKKSKEISLIIKRLSNLQVLYLHDAHLPDCSFLKNLSQLQLLDLSNSFIEDEDYSSLKGLNQLTVLDLSNNYIKGIPFLNGLNCLTAIDLSYNQIEDISSLERLNQLTVLDLSYNYISKLSALQKLNKLREVNLAANKINKIFAFRKFNSLRRLNLENNCINRLPAWITELSPDIVFSGGWEEDKINVYGNPLIHPPPEIIQIGREAIQAYFRSFKKSKAVKLHEAKVLLVGEGMAGKTSLLKQLQGLDFDKKESQTHGINVLSLSNKEIPGLEQEEECRLHFWDFGGQEIMHASHRFFMSNRSLYILVLDSRTDSRKFHWLRHIEKYGGKSPLIVAMNKIDANPSYNIEQKSINASFPWIENRFFRISCKNGEGLSELVRSLAASISTTPLYGMEISKSWLAIRTELEQATEAKNYIDQEQFIAICEKHGVEDKISRMTLLKLLNDLVLCQVLILG